MWRILTGAALALMLDQGSKYYVLHVLDLLGARVIGVAPPVLQFRLAWNRGVNFGLFSNDYEVMRWVLVSLAVVISVWIFRWARHLPVPSGQFLAGLVIGGALGNVVDRLAYGAVADFLNMSCCGLKNPYAFNFADVSIFVGAFGLVLFSNKLDKNG